MAGVIKYGFDDVRPVLERSSARETVTRTAIAAVCRCLLEEFGIGIRSHVVRIGPVTGEEPHLLLGHTGTVWQVAVSPDGRWIASVSDEVRLWPMPDMTKPPLHALPHAELLAKLDSLTNLRLLPDPSSATGWKLDVGPFPGWRDVPTW